MRLTFLHILFGLAATSMVVPSGAEPAVDSSPKLIPRTEKPQVSVIDGLQSREIGGGFSPVLPPGNPIPADGDDSSKSRRAFIRKDEIVVPESLQEPSSKRALLCNAGWEACSGKKYCCPIGESCSPVYPCISGVPLRIPSTPSLQCERRLTAGS